MVKQSKEWLKRPDMSDEINTTLTWDIIINYNYLTTFSISFFSIFFFFISILLQIFLIYYIKEEKKKKKEKRGKREKPNLRQ